MLFIWISSTWIQKTMATFLRISLVCLREYLFRPIPLPSSLSFASLRLRFLPLWALEPFYAQLVNKSHSPAFSTQSSLLNIRQTFNSQIHSCSLIQGLWKFFVVTTHVMCAVCLSLFVSLSTGTDQWRGFSTWQSEDRSHQSSLPRGRTPITHHLQWIRLKRKWGINKLNSGPRLPL